MTTKRTKFTVLLMYPDYLSENYGEETYLAHVTARSPREAGRLAKREAFRVNQVEDAGARSDDFDILATFRGHLIDHTE